MASACAVSHPSHSWAKIRLKHAAKQYKRGPGPTGRDRLARRVNSLLVAAQRVARQASDEPDRQWAARLVQALMAFHAETRQPFQQQGLF